ncbi:helix-turn-helix transcriptional regulator [Streptomyces sp. TLI_053]|uniref:helix-turn-helix domain-containing protein n=1 Tax=Streptomyces sp. TLI_053 TaxID=1855352 RepID=UPI0013520E93|nr:helix-turn-helix transcriptional regulator [Streptomyces sp. TLI_053]
MRKQLGAPVEGPTLAELRKAAGYTQETFVAAFSDMAQRMDVRAIVSVRQLRRWESSSPPTPHSGQQDVLEALLGVPLAELGFVVPLRRSPSPSKDRSREDDLQRRRFVLDAGALLGASVLPPTRTGRRVGAADVQIFRSKVTDLYTIDHSQGGRVARQAAKHTLQSVERAMVDGIYLEGVGRDLHALAGTLHSHLGWIEFDAGRPAAARSACTEALTAARLVGDPLMEVRALDSLSLLAVEQKRPWEAIASSMAAERLAQARGGPKVKSVVALRQARALSSAGDHAGARRALSTALAWQDRSDKDADAPPWTAFAGQVEVDYATAAWHVETGHIAHAIPFLRSAISQLGPTYTRNAALYRARLAEVLMKAGDVEEACQEAVASAGAAKGMTSARLVDRLSTVASMARQVDTAVARDCVEELRALGVSTQRQRVA